MQRFEGMQLVDSHLHVWSPTYQYATGKLPPPDLGGDVSSVEAFRDVMHRHGISGALVVQPVNYAYDHRCVVLRLSVLVRHTWSSGCAASQLLL